VSQAAEAADVVDVRGAGVLICIGADHAGFALKETVKAHLIAEGHDLTDVGAYSDQPVDYPVIAEQVGRAVADGSVMAGVLVCGTGMGMAIAANKVNGVRAVQVGTPAFAEMSRRHNDANVITLAGRSLTGDEAFAVVDAFLNTGFEGGRHQRRIDEISAIEAAGTCTGQSV
jgi:ribose 5-phosphate isomerase B